MNRLAQALSPYLLQHKDNPVDWYPWGEEAFQHARETDRPIFLSIGYAACHWCHVMEHESFESEAIADYLNRHFVSIKVDREERPDIDQIYMNAVQVMTGHGGWPMSVFLNHDLKPFYAGTYWPPNQRYGMPGFSQVLTALVDAWQNRREDVENHAGEITSALSQMAVGVSEAGETIPTTDVIGEATDRLLRVLDRQEGGFGGAPKFPHSTDLDLLLRQGAIRGDRQLIDAAVFTLDKMAAGGIYDHLGGGFARYSVDAQWLVPHFEKMLYDNALLAEVYTRAFQVTRQQRHADVACGVLDYLIRDMADDAGGFHSSEDADSEGVEGKFYVWKPQEVIDVLGEERGERFCQVYDVTDSGNFEGNSILRLQKSVDQWADELSQPHDSFVKQLAEDREKLRLHRESRVHPGRDDKVLTSWNALAIKALAIGGAVLDRTDYLTAAQRAGRFVLETMKQDGGRLLHAFRQGQAHLDGYLDDHAYMIEAFIALFQTTADESWIREAILLADIVCDRFQDQESGGFFFTADNAESLITRNKDWHDGSVVSGNASAASGLLQLSMLTGIDRFRDAAERTFQAAEEILQKQYAACAGLLSALDLYWSGNQQTVIAVTDQTEVQRVRTSVYQSFQPQATLSWVVGQSATDSTIELNRDRKPMDGQLTIYKCENFTCEMPMIGEAAERFLEGS